MKATGREDFLWLKGPINGVSLHTTSVLPYNRERLQTKETRPNILCCLCFDASCTAVLVIQINNGKWILNMSWTESIRSKAKWARTIYLQWGATGTENDQHFFVWSDLRNVTLILIHPAAQKKKCVVGCTRGQAYCNNSQPLPLQYSASVRIETIESGLKQSKTATKQSQGASCTGLFCFVREAWKTKKKCDAHTEKEQWQPLDVNASAAANIKLHDTEQRDIQKYTG